MQVPQISKTALATFVFQNERGNAQVDITEQDSVTVNVTNKNV